MGYVHLLDTAHFSNFGIKFSHCYPHFPLIFFPVVLAFIKKHLKFQLYEAMTSSKIMQYNLLLK